jgi:hypothetical protein
METNEMIDLACEIVGPADMSSNGREGRVEVTGEFADALIDELGLIDSFTQHFRGKPIRVSRYGGLELWVHGWYTEGSGVRRIVQRAAAAMRARQSAGVSSA